MVISSDQLLADPIANFPKATVAAFDPTQGDLPRRSLDPEKTQAFVSRLAELGAPGLLVASSTGQGHLRTVAELADWFDCVATANSGNTVNMALLRPEDGPESIQQLLGQLVNLGFPLVFFRPGTDLSQNAGDADVIENLRPCIQAAAAYGLAVGLYSIPDVSGMRLSADAAAALLEEAGGDHIVAAKITEADYQQSTLQFLQHPKLSRLKIVQGWDPFLMQALQHGPRYDHAGRQRCGVTSGPMSLAIHQYLHILAQTEEGSWDEVSKAQQAVTTVFQSMQDDPDRFADLQRAKFIMGLGHPLTGEIQDDQVERVFTALESLPRAEDRQRLAASLDLMGDGPYHQRLAELAKR